MSIGQHIFWIVVDLHTQRALTPQKDFRRAMQFVSREAATAEVQRQNRVEIEKAQQGASSYDTGRYIVIEVPA